MDIEVDLNPQLPAIDTSREAWLFVAGSLTLELIVWGFGYSAGILQEYYAQDPHSPFRDASTISITSVATIGVGLQYILGFFLEPLYKAYPGYIRISMWICLVIAAGSFAVSSAATSVYQLILLQGVIFGFASAALYFPVIIWLSEWFLHRRSTAAGLIFGASTAGGMIFPFLFRLLLDHLSYANTMRVWAAIFLALGAAAIPFVKPRIVVPQSEYRRKLLIPNLDFMATSTFLWFGVTVFAQRLAYTPITVLIASYTKDFGGTPIQSTLSLVLLNFAGMLGYIITGYTADRTEYWRIMVVSGVCAAVAASCVLGFAHGVPLIYVFVLAFGITSGGYAASWTAAAKSIKEEASGTVFLVYSVIAGVATVIGPLLAGVLRRHDSITEYGSHGFTNVVIYITTLMCIVAGIGILLANRLKH